MTMMDDDDLHDLVKAETEPVAQIPLFTIYGFPIADVFEEWHRRWIADPDGFLSEVESRAQESGTYGEETADTFVWIAEQMYAAAHPPAVDIGVK